MTQRPENCHSERASAMQTGRVHHLERKESRGISPSRVARTRAVRQSSPEGEGIPPPRRSRGRALHSQSDGCAGAQGRDSSRPLPHNMTHRKPYRVSDRARNDTKAGELSFRARIGNADGTCASPGTEGIARNLALTHWHALRAVSAKLPGGRGYSTAAPPACQWHLPEGEGIQQRRAKTDASRRAPYELILLRGGGTQAKACAT